MSTPSLSVTWKQPAFLLPLFGLCCLLGVSNSLTAALSLCVLLSIAVLCMAVIIPPLRHVCNDAALPIVWLMVSSVLIAMLELLLRASLYALYRELSIFLPLASVALLPLARQEMLREASSARQLFKRALSMCAGLMLAGGVLGTGRELVGHGSLFHDAPQLWGPWAQALPMRFFRPDMGFLLAVLAPGAFIGLGLGVALYNWLWLRIRPASLPPNT